ncbi:SusD/RagB family nutrient-binding outer membrane lipoprotein [Niabella beijingensis]|uniref:SusD/RagB family nutrient-binding outer membrane lipoprotein n=1 Tax=Niabella beijingensis TaxID=2872700 RepID=UPI001CC0178D|nr:SusD/RagB family nutrient-binding outer membrane lipoprotein [Niabella beijingensis]MBZ4190676.1 SusD/RagB family nutrient-binding outer membrane lipoprotein [Niabella beijingensis]
MKKISIYIFSILAFGGCKKFVDINDNPNAATGKIDEEVLMPKTIVEYANGGPAADLYGAGMVGYLVNPGGVSGFGSVITYNYGPGDFAAFWNIYDNIQDLNEIIKRGETDPSFLYYSGAAKVLKALSYQQLVDTYNNVPYSAANQGGNNLTPEYDKAEDIYKSLASLVDGAMKDFTDGAVNPTSLALTNARDPLFQGNITNWKKLANTVKLRIILRAKEKIAFENTTFSSDGFLTEDAIVQPGYTNVDGKVNPTWTRAYNVAGSQQGGGLQQRVPSFYILGFYNNNKLNDKFRGYLMYRSFPNPGVNQLGFDPGTDAAARVKAPNDWFLAKGTPSASNFLGIGVFKGPDAFQPIVLAAESYFLQAEGALKGLVTTITAKEAFEKGILASFTYLNKDKNNAVSTTISVNKTTGELVKDKPANDPNYVAINPASEVETYKADNSGNYLVDFDLATTSEQKLEAIITQKYIALNLLFGGEAWNEYRRTGYPKTTQPSVANKYTSFASLQSLATTPDKLPTRIQYPTNEFQYNTVNVNAQKGTAPNGGINVLADKIFWAK